MGFRIQKTGYAGRWAQALLRLLEQTKGGRLNANFFAASVCLCGPPTRQRRNHRHSSNCRSMWHRAGERSVYSPAWPGVRGVCLVCGAACADTSPRNARSNSVVLLPHGHQNLLWKPSNDLHDGGRHRVRTGLI